MGDKFNFNDDEDDAGGNEWLATYGDLVTLLLCFFILLYSMSTIDAQKFKALANSMQQIGISSQGGSVITSAGDSILDMDGIRTTKEMGNIYVQIEKLIKEKELDKDISLSKNENGILLRFSDEILFDSGQADLKTNSKSTLGQIAQILKKHNKNIKVEGHTDNIPIETSKYANNWELSTARAISVVKFFTQELSEKERLDPKKFEVSGYGEYHPVAPNDSESNRRKNRRIEVLIENNIEP
jgi:chemotaxis protein MotB